MEASGAQSSAWTPGPATPTSLMSLFPAAWVSLRLQDVPSWKVLELRVLLGLLGQLLPLAS